MASSHVVLAPPRPLLHLRPLASPTKMFVPGQSQTSSCPTAPEMAPPRLPCDSSLMESRLDDEDPTLELRVDTAPPDLVAADHPVFGTDIGGLTNTDAAWMWQQFLDFYSENTWLSTEAKFAHSFSGFVRTMTCKPFPHTRCPFADMFILFTMKARFRCILFRSI